MNTDFKVGDVVRHKSGGRDAIIIRFEYESVDGVTKKLAVCGRFEGQNFQQEIIPVEMRGVCFSLKANPRRGKS